MYIIQVVHIHRKVCKMETLNIVGIISENKNIPFIKEMLKNKLLKVKIIYLNNENIENLKNIKFETIVIVNDVNKIIDNIETVKKIIKNAETVLINSDIKDNLEIIKNLKINAITFGFSSKATITTSSIEEGEILVCIQRTIKSNKNNEIEPQEIKIKSDKNKLEENATNTMAIVGLAKLYDCL